MKGGEAPLYNYVVKYKALLVVDVVKLTVSLTGLIVMLTTPWQLACQAFVMLTRAPSC